MYGWPYVDLDNQPGCVRVAYQDSTDFYSNHGNGADVEARDTAESRDISRSKERFVKHVTHRYKRWAMAGDPKDYDYDENDNYDNNDDNDDGDDDGDNDKDRESEADKKLRKFCNMDIDGTFTVKGQEFTTSKIPNVNEEDDSVEMDAN